MGFGYAVYFTERVLSHVLRWEPDTGQVDVVAGEPKDGDGGQLLRSPYGLTIDSDGHLLIADKGGGRICRLISGRLEPLSLRDVDGHRARRPETRGFYSPQPICPTGLFMEKEGTLLCSFSDDHTIYRIHKDGRLELVLGTVGNRVYPPVQGSLDDVPPTQIPNLRLRVPTGVIKRSDGTIFFIERRLQCVREYHPLRGLRSIFPKSQFVHFCVKSEAPLQGRLEDYHPAYPSCLALDSSENLYMTDSAHRCLMLIDLKKGVFRRLLQQPAQGRLGGPAAVEFGPDGTAWVLDSTSKTIQGYRPRKDGEWEPTDQQLSTFRKSPLVLPRSGSGITTGA